MNVVELTASDLASRQTVFRRIIDTELSYSVQRLLIPATVYAIAYQGSSTGGPRAKTGPQVIFFVLKFLLNNNNNVGFKVWGKKI